MKARHLFLTSISLIVITGLGTVSTQLQSLIRNYKSFGGGWSLDAIQTGFEKNDENY